MERSRPHPPPLRWAQDDEELEAAIALRERVFCDEQGVPRELEVDGLDRDALHLVALAPGPSGADEGAGLGVGGRAEDPRATDGPRVIGGSGVTGGSDVTGRPRVIGTLRLLTRPDQDQVKIGRVAVDRAWRRRGVASAMLAAALARARELGASRARLAAQLDATSVYERAGFSVQSGPFEEAGIVHVWMGRELD